MQLSTKEKNIAAKESCLLLKKGKDKIDSKGKRMLLFRIHRAKQEMKVKKETIVAK